MGTEATKGRQKSSKTLAHKEAQQIDIQASCLWSARGMRIEPFGNRARGDRVRTPDTSNIHSLRYMHSACGDEAGLTIREGRVIYLGHLKGVACPSFQKHPFS